MATTHKEKDTVSFRLPKQKRVELDRVAAEAVRDRSFVLNEAIDAYLEVKRWQIAHIEAGLKEARAGHFASAKEVAAVFGKR
ncbi:MAG: CopG family transcriptional regulator [Patescibacteria group bacterium]